MTQIEVLTAARCRNARSAMSLLKPGAAFHGLSDGTWSFIDALSEILAVAGPSDVLVSTWTAAKADTLRAERLLRSENCRSWRMLVDRSFRTRQPAYCALVRETFGDGAIRVWNCHAKFCMVTGGGVDVLYLTSANLNQNRRIENFSVYAVPEMVAAYRRLVDGMFAAQGPGEGFGDPASCRPVTERVFHG